MIVFGYRLPLFSSLVIWAILWEILGHTDAKLILPPLSAITLRIFEIVPTESFLKALIITGKAFLAGSLISVFVGIPLGVLMGRSKVADDLLLPWVNVFLSAPLSALVPVIMVVAGIGETTMVLTVVLFAVWIVMLNARAGVRKLENVQYPQADGTVCGIRPATDPEGGFKLDCGDGLGAATHVTGAFAFAAAAKAIELLLGRKSK